MKTILVAATTLVASAGVALANTPTICATFPQAAACATPVPEISALEGTAAIAALAAIVLIAWERRRRAV